MVSFTKKSVKYYHEGGVIAITELAILRMRRGVTQKMMAERTGINVSTLSLIERKRLVPSSDHRRKIVAAYGIEEADFFDEKSGLAI